MKTTASKYIVMSAGRCASNLVCEYLARVLEGNSQRMATKSTDHTTIRHTAADNLILNRSTIVHDHELWTPVPQSSWRLILVTRDNTWAQALSWAIANRSQEFHVYTHQLEPFHLEWEELQRIHNWILQKNANMEKLATSTWKSVTRLRTEHFLADIDGMRQRIPGFYNSREFTDTASLHSQQSPYAPGNVILNWWEIEQQIKRKYNN